MATKGKLAALAGGLAFAATFIGGWEGLSLTAYKDRLAHDIPTICYGETRGVKLGDKHTKAECDAMLQNAIAQFENGLDKCLRPLVPLPQKTKVALVSWSYNVGLGAACKSTLVQLVNQGKTTAACNELRRWNRAGGKVVNGLTRRRESERDLCLTGLAEQNIPLPTFPTKPVIIVQPATPVESQCP